MARTADGHRLRRRPRDRKAQIARASAEAFSELGYHGVSMEAIAARVGISAAALYRHYPSKYDLLRGAVLNLGQQLVDCTAEVDGAGPAQVLDQLVSALIDTALSNRASGGLYRWEGRYLRGDDRVQLLDQMRTVHRRLHGPLLQLRPELTARQCSVLSTATLSVVGSVVDHRAKLPAAQAHELLGQLASAVLNTELPEVGAESITTPERPGSGAPIYEALLVESLRLFHANGYRDTAMGDIAAAVGIPTSTIYKYFSGKSDILAAAFRRAADRLSADLAEITATVTDPADALAAMIDAYVSRSFDQPELDYVYYSDRLSMTPSDQRILRVLQRSMVESWVEMVVAVRPEWTAGQARFAVHAAMAVVIDLGRLAHYAATAEARVTVQRLVDVTLLGGHRMRTTSPAG
ncbi:TetR/AcrR family transcriptional regulator [Mycolicibacterium sp.]|uniref:TetR/AcrR family transcriptional regulator n=1 Tax=Mycolicibacterium sp. TaxID=2320850 RepID=UPI003D0E6528